ncbi:MAG TPA: GSU2403 family nucleotidyltransferase fold protein [Planctomycetota bacterium]|nr:GSU2403 family nucleotidyltransferase fold protein [Planctomycetota bacterium]
MPVFDERDLVAALQPIKPYLGDLVLCGGWTLLIYRRWVVMDGGPLPMATMDLDLAVSRRLDVVSRPVNELLREAGFRENYIGMDEPTITYVKEGAPEIEFLTPRSGNRPAHPVEVQRGLKADPLRFIEVILESTRTVTLRGMELRIRVPTPEAYLYQKGLSFPRRRDDAKKAKDLAYLFELLHNFPSLREDLPTKLGALRRRHPRGWFTTFKDNLNAFIPASGGEGVGMVADQRPHPFDAMLVRDPTNGPGLFKELVRGAFRTFLEQI